MDVLDFAYKLGDFDVHVPPLFWWDLIEIEDGIIVLSEEGEEYLKGDEGMGTAKTSFGDHPLSQGERA
jgi:hypothetical protein